MRVRLLHFDSNLRDRNVFRISSAFRSKSVEISGSEYLYPLRHEIFRIAVQSCSGNSGRALSQQCSFFYYFAYKVTAKASNSTRVNLQRCTQFEAKNVSGRL